MTPERWRQIDNLFDAALQLDPAVRRAWLEQACGNDDELRAEVISLLNQDARADQDGFLTPPSATGVLTEPTGDWPPSDGHHSPKGPEPTDHRRDDCGDDPDCFSPKAAIARSEGASSGSEPPSVVQARLRELVLIYLGIFGMAIAWRQIVLGRDALGVHAVPVMAVNVFVLVVLAGITAMLSGETLFRSERLKSLELGVVVMLAGMLAFAQYRLMLEASLRDDTLVAQLVFKNIVLITSVLILTYGLYVPKSWRRAAVVVGPLAVMPFATLLVLYLNHPEQMGWLERGWRKNFDTSRLTLFSFDAMILLIVAAGSAFGAHRMARLRRQVAEARHLGQYRLRKRIGGGGMGEVYLAEHHLLKRPCAIKMIQPEGLSEPNALVRFEREVQLTATLSHPNTVEVFDYGRTEDGTYYYVMEYLPGMSLGDLVERHGPLPPARAVYLLRQVCGALSEAHMAGLIHRDVKPSNIFAARRGGMDDVAKLLDFGLVQPVTPRAAHLSAEGQVLGTPRFMSPEQARGRELDARSDIYSLGAVAYYLLTGRPPFDEDDGIEVMIAHARDPVVPPSQVRSGIPADLERVVLRCLAKSPADRFPDAQRLERELSECSCAAEWNLVQASRWWRGTRRAKAARTISA
jgi:eukaryotic-like serine/threonine-protein kinase